MQIIRSMAVAALAVVALSTSALAAPAQPSGAHPRLFLDTPTKDALKRLATVPTSATARAIKRCDDVIANPTRWKSGGYQGMGWHQPFGACAIAYVVRGDAASGTAAVKYFKALLDDYATIGDGAGGDNVVQHDSGYSMRAYAPYAAIGYDWLYNAPGVDATLRARARQRFKAWTTWYATSGYNPRRVGSNYHAGYAFGATLIAIAQAGEAGTDGAALWTHVVDTVHGVDLAAGLAPGGVLDGGDWLEGWQYGPLSVISYALAARALRQVGVDNPRWATWEAALIARSHYARTPDKKGSYIGGDSDITTPYRSPNALTLYAGLAGNASATAKAQGLAMLTSLTEQESSFLFLAALAETRAPTTGVALPTTAPTTFYAPGSRTLYARTSWAASGVWMATKCASRRVPDHTFNDAGNVVLSRGADHLIVDPSPYGSFSSLTGNAPTTTSPQLPTNYRPSQGFWGNDTVDFKWARQTTSGVVAARCDYGNQYMFQGRVSDVPSAVRDLVLVPHGTGDATLIIVDKLGGTTSSQPLDLRLRTIGTLAMGGNGARATVGTSRLAIQVAAKSAGTPTVGSYTVGTCDGLPRGQCAVGRFAGTQWKLGVPAAAASTVHIVDAVAATATPAAATVTTGTGWRATQLDRGGKHIAVVDVTTGSTSVTYRAAAGVHVVVGAPAGSTGRATVTARVESGICAVTATPATSGGFDARPLVLNVSSTCTLTEDVTQAQSTFRSVHGDDAADATGTDGDLDEVSSDLSADDVGDDGVTDEERAAGCSAQPAPGSSLLAVAVFGFAGLALRRRRRAAA